MNKQELAVEWLFKKLWEEPKDKFTWYSLLKQAKELNKEQIISGYLSGVVQPLERDAVEQSEHYYNEKYENL